MLSSPRRDETGIRRRSGFLRSSATTRRIARPAAAEDLTASSISGLIAQRAAPFT